MSINKKYISIAGASFALISALACGCSNLKNNNYSVEDNSNLNKKILRIATDSCPEDDVVKFVNDTLDEKNLGYNVEYVSLYSDDTPYSERTKNDYIERLSKASKSGDYDLCFTGMIPENYYKNVYDEIVSDGLVYAIDDYLASANGQALYESIPELKWESLKREGHIYGVNGYVYNLRVSPAYVVNKKLMDKYKITTDDLNKPLDELKDILLTVQQGEADNNNFKSLRFSVLSFDFQGMVTANSDINGIVIDKNGEAKCLIDCEEYMQVMKATYDAMQAEGVSFGVSLDRVADEIENMSGYSPLADSCFINMYIEGYNPINDVSNSNMYQGLEGYEENDFVVIYPYGEYFDISYDNSANCVFASSQNIPEALDYLNQIYTDKALCDYLIYGKERRDYVVENNRAYTPYGGALLPNTSTTSWRYGNGFICTISGNDRSNRDEIIKEIYSEKGECLYPGFFWHREKDEMIDTYNTLIYKLHDVFTSGEDFDTYMDNLRAELKEAGVDELVADCQKAFDEWKK